MTAVKAVNHIGIAVHSIEAQRPFYEGTLGAVFEGTEEVPSQKVRVGFFRIGDVRLELLEPTEPASTVATQSTLIYQPFFAGISLDVTPQIDDRDRVTLHVHAMVNSIVEKQKASVPTTSRSADGAICIRSSKLCSIHGRKSWRMMYSLPFRG